MSFDHPHAFADPSLIPMDRADRGALAKLLSLVLDAEPPMVQSATAGGGRGQLAKWLYDQRRRREQFLPQDLFGEPAWDILLVLYEARISQCRMSVSAVCAAAGAPPTTALRHIDHLCTSGHVVKNPHPTDRRVSWLSLADDINARMNGYFDRLLGNLPAPAEVISAH